MRKAEPLKLAQISVRGVVQGVGFRPAVFHVARKFGLKGWVCNTTEDVKIEVEGERTRIDRFLVDLEIHAPLLARIESITHQISGSKGYRGFQIVESQSLEGGQQLIPPDVAICPRCERDISEPDYWCYRYPFTNCTQCGVRFTIIEAMPYDRPNTSMRHFEMCPRCRKEYEDPSDRRFHAQPNACPTCFPRLKLVDRAGLGISAGDPIACAGKLLREGNTVALKGLEGFLLACDATNSAAVQRLGKRKRRALKPLAVMMRSLKELKRYCHLSREEEALLISWISPIVLLRRRETGLICWEAASNLNYLGVMLPYSPLHHLLLRDTGRPLIMTSGNRSEEPIMKDDEEAWCKLADVADFFLLHDRQIFTACDDSVLMPVNGKPLVIRRARGYAPDPVRLPFKVKEVLACGADLKNIFCVTKDECAFMSQHIGDMENLEALRR